MSSSLLMPPSAVFEDALVDIGLDAISCVPDNPTDGDIECAFEDADGDAHEDAADGNILVAFEDVALIVPSLFAKKENFCNLCIKCGKLAIMYECGVVTRVEDDHPHECIIINPYVVHILFYYITSA